jgi:hypothetical protein
VVHRWLYFSNLHTIFHLLLLSFELGRDIAGARLLEDSRIVGMGSTRNTKMCWLRRSKSLLWTGSCDGSALSEGMTEGAMARDRGWGWQQGDVTQRSEAGEVKVKITEESSECQKNNWQ